MTENPIGSVGEPNPRRYVDVLPELPAVLPAGAAGKLLNRGIERKSRTGLETVRSEWWGLPRHRLRPRRAKAPRAFEVPSTKRRSVSASWSTLSDCSAISMSEGSVLNGSLMDSILSSSS